ncbi:KH domain-containing RNA-binding protein qki.L-like isoform X1 [Ylistrum balloti]|uniref:KH domain-containing RNA-binding protein qki.L-like isoform X1 n=1 Tax=Ylistrum balloti TaxID=509963 RepID=UPI002905EDDA|nr:KH domain-containing RNA-binding protein qki.L-like isoform X1 [Ylistrum balloti]
MGTETNKDERNTPEYLAQLLKDKKQIQAFPNVFVHLEKLLDEEINRVRLQLFHHKGSNRDPLPLPEVQGPTVTLSEKLYVPVKEHPDFNFVGRILGPRGMTAKELEQFTGCKIMVRGKGSMRDKKKEEQNRGKANWEHLNEELHVLITVEDARQRAEVKMAKAIEEVKKLLVPAPDGEDDLKKRQLMELAIINGTYRDTSKPSPSSNSQTSTTPGMKRPWDLANIQGVGVSTSVGQGEAPRLITTAQQLSHIPNLRTQTPQGAPIILTPRIPTSQAGIVNGPPPLVSPTEAATGLVYNPYEYSPYSAAAFHQAAALIEYPSSFDQANIGAVPKIRRTLEGMRAHPYARVSLP